MVRGPSAFTLPIFSVKVVKRFFSLTLTGNFAISGYQRVKALVKEVADKINPELKLLGPVFNMVKKKTRNFEELYEKCRNLYGENLFTNFIRYSTVVRDAMRSKRTLFEYFPITVSVMISEQFLMSFLKEAVMTAYQFDILTIKHSKLNLKE